MCLCQLNCSSWCNSQWVLLEIAGQMWHRIVDYPRKEELFHVGMHLKFEKKKKKEPDHILSLQEDPG